MSLYAIGDLHLSLGTDKPMDVFGRDWENYVEKLIEGFKDLSENDVCVICGDVSWGMNLKEAAEDFLFISRLPGQDSTEGKPRLLVVHGLEGIRFF